MSAPGATSESVELRVQVPSTAEEGQTWGLAATVFFPLDEALHARPAVLVAMPGAGYSRRYFDLQEPGYSEAAYHTEHGTVVVALDHLGVGDSSIPPFEVTTLSVVAAANHAAVTFILDRLRNGTLAPNLGAIDPVCVVGAGQSMGGHVLVGMQAYHRTFDAVAMLGSSMVGTTMPTMPGRSEVSIPEGASAAEAAALVTKGTDWRFAFFWDDVPASFVEMDFAGGHPMRRTAPPWGSVTWPGLATALVLPGAVASEAAQVDVPVLVAMGERDVCREPLHELSAFRNATDMAAFVVPRMAHMHNFAGTRRRMWDRIDAFIAQLATAANAP